MSKNNHKIALAILNQLDLSDSKTAYNLLYLIAENNPYAIIKANDLMVLKSIKIQSEYCM